MSLSIPSPDRLVEHVVVYISEVETAMIYIRESPVLSSEEKRRFFKSANMNLGISALCLSVCISRPTCSRHRELRHYREVPHSDIVSNRRLSFKLSSDRSF